MATSIRELGKTFQLGTFYSKTVTQLPSIMQIRCYPILHALPLLTHGRLPATAAPLAEDGYNPPSCRYAWYRCCYAGVHRRSRSMGCRGRATVSPAFGAVHGCL